MQQQQQQGRQKVVVDGDVMQPRSPVQWEVQPVASVTSRFGHQAIGIGTALVITGSLSVILNMIEVIKGIQNDVLAFGIIGHGFWCGVMCIISGGIGIGAGKRKSRVLIHAFKVFCVISACMGATQLALGIAGAVVYEHEGHYHYYYRYDHTGTVSNTIATESFIAALGFVQSVVSVWGSIVSCLATPPQSMLLVGNSSGMTDVSQQQQQQQQNYYPVKSSPPPHQYNPPYELGYQTGQDTSLSLQSPPQYNGQPTTKARF